ncbi:hypothetical protein CABS03_13051 [Colletotrichum abscissum]|uniref:Uncharacterized protein n=2 Tax=Colletotrichum acutatum species complex TaxID=2707335 RepID=A0A9P9XBK6_9PEZI|nr:hypothetical protein CABS02_08970 [Colletotrichum abscissum]KAK0374650.1 hypothetical protein CLIM01_07980 [Colletotrichum limetticola]
MIGSPQWRENLDVRGFAGEKNPSERRPTPCPRPETPWSDRVCGAVTISRSIGTGLAVCTLLRICSSSSRRTVRQRSGGRRKRGRFTSFPRGRTKRSPGEEARGRWAGEKNRDQAQTRPEAEAMKH